MAETSFPVLDQPLTDKQWSSVTKGIGDGVLDDGGNPYRLESLSNAQNTGVIRVDRGNGDNGGPGYAHAILSGFYHKIDADLTVSLPAVTSTTTFYIALQYDPTRSTMPVKLVVVKSLDYSGGKTYCVLHTVRRQANQLLTDAVRTAHKPKVAPTIVVDTEDLLPPVDHVLWGTLAVAVHPTFQMFRAGVDTQGDDAGSLKWYSLTDPNWIVLGDTSTYRWPGHGARRAIQKIGRTRKLRGRLERVSGENFNTGNTTGYLMMSLGGDDVPANTQAFITTCQGTSSPGYARVEVSATSGEVRAYVAQNTGWVSLDGIVFDTK